MVVTDEADALSRTIIVLLVDFSIVVNIKFLMLIILQALSV